MTQALSTPDYFPSNSLLCSVKNPSDHFYNTTYFVSNIPCTTSCLGSKASPFDSVMKALNQIHNKDFAEKFYLQNIQIYLWSLDLLFLPVVSKVLKRIIFIKQKHIYSRGGEGASHWAGVPAPGATCLPPTKNGPWRSQKKISNFLKQYIYN